MARIPKQKLLLTVYVDDFLLSGPEHAHGQFWKELAEGSKDRAPVNLEDIGGLDSFLGRHHEIVSVDGKRAMSFNMTDYVKLKAIQYNNDGWEHHKVLDIRKCTEEDYE